MKNQIVDRIRSHNFLKTVIKLKKLILPRTVRSWVFPIFGAFSSIVKINKFRVF